MPSIDLKKFPGFTQQRHDFCLLACIQNILYYHDSEININQFELDKHFRKYINPKTDHPYFKFFAKYIGKIKPQYQGAYDEFDKFQDFIEKIKMCLDDKIPIMFSLKSQVVNGAHIVIACDYEGDLLKYFDPNDELTDTFITIKFEQVRTILKGSTKFDTLSVILTRNQVIN